MRDNGQRRSAEPYPKFYATMTVDVFYKDMINSGGNIHGGCSAFLVDMYALLSKTRNNLQVLIG